jgi:hypothetical protein
VKVKITTKVLDAMNTGMHHDLLLVTRARQILEAAGCEVEVHPVELAEIERLRRMGANLIAEAERMAAGLGSRELT